MNRLILSLLTLCILVALSSCDRNSTTNPPNDDPVTPVANISFQIDSSITDVFGDAYALFIQETVGKSVIPVNQIPNIFNGITVPIVLTFCHEANAFYTPSTRSITLCDELFDDAYRFFSNLNGVTEVDAESRAADTMSFFMYHEIGHAADDILNIPFPGNDESAMDGVASILSVKTGQPGIAVRAARYFNENIFSTLAAEHPSGPDRAGDIMCDMTGGSREIAMLYPQFVDQFANASRDCVGSYGDQLEFIKQYIPGLESVTAIDFTADL